MDLWTLLRRKPPRWARLNPQHALAHKVQAFWACNDGGGGFLADAARRHRATIDYSGGFSWVPSRGWHQGWALQSAATGGSAGINFGGTGFPALTRFAIECWLTTSSGGSDGYGALCTEGSAQGLYMRNTGSGDKLDYFASSADHLATTTLAANTLYHLVVTTRGTGAIDFYVNAVADGSASFTVPSFTPGLLLNDSTSETFVGTLHTLRIYNFDLNSDEVQYLYHFPWDLIDDTPLHVLLDQAKVGSGPVSVTPAASTLTLSTVAPTVLLGALTITPAASTLTLATVNPTVSLGAVTVTPAVGSLALTTLDPTVLLGGITVTPAASSLVLGTVNPTVVAPGLLLTPAPSTLLLRTLAPSVITGAGTGTPTPPPAPPVVTLPIEELLLDSHYSLVRRIMAPQRVASLGAGGQALRRMGERPTYEFVLQDRQRVQSAAEALYGFAQYHQGDRPFWFTGGRWGTISTPIVFGVGDGARTSFLLNNRHIEEDSLTVYADGDEATLGSVDWEVGSVRLTTAPDMDVVLTATYQCRYLCVFAVQQEVLLQEELFYHQLYAYEGIVLRELLIPKAVLSNLEQWEYSTPGWDDLVSLALEDWET